MRYRRVTKGKRKRLLLFRLVLIYLLVALVQYFFLQSFRIGSNSMSPTLQRNDRVIARPLSIEAIAFHPDNTEFPIQRGELLFLYPPYVQPEGRWYRMMDRLIRFVTLQQIGFSRYRPLVRRVIGLPGDRIEMESFIFFIKEPTMSRFQSEFMLSNITYKIAKDPLPSGWKSDLPFSAQMPQITVPYGKLFVAADNRSAALDSRHWAAVDVGRVSHRAVLHWQLPARLLWLANSKQQ